MKKILLLSTAFMFTLGVMAQPKPDDVIKVNAETYYLTLRLFWFYAFCLF